MGLARTGGQPTRRASMWWAIGSLLYGIDFLIVASHGSTPAWCSAVVANGLFVASFVAMAAGLRLLHALPCRSTTLLGAAVVVFCVAENAWLLGRENQVNLRLAIGTLCQIAVAVPILATPLLVKRRQRTAAFWLLIGSFAVFTLVFIQRLLFLALGAPMESNSDRPAVQAFSYAVLAMLPLVSALGFTQLCSRSVYEEFARTARLDSLTGCLNRGALEERARTRIDEAKEHGRALTLLLIDLNKLKEINDSRGHDAGDAALVSLVDAVTPLLRPCDVFGRMGGDEFIAVLDGVDTVRSSRIVTELRQRLVQQNTRWPARAAVSVSVGLESLEADDDLQSLTRRADVAMYEEKRVHRRVDGSMQMQPT